MFTVHLDSVPMLLLAGLRASVLGHGVVEGDVHADVRLKFMARRERRPQRPRTLVLWGGIGRAPSAQELGVECVLKLDTPPGAVRAALEALAPSQTVERSAEVGTPLTPRERAILARVATGATSREIGSALGISERTVEVHRRNLLKKLGVRRSAGLVTTALAHQVL